MIGKANSISHTHNALNYAENKLKAEMIDKHFISGNNALEIENGFKMCQNLNGRCKNNTLAIVISPEPSEGQKLNDNDFRIIAAKFLKQMKLEDHQAVIYKHRDTKHTHLHIYANRIGFDGKAAKDNFIGKKAQLHARKIAQEMGLTTALEVQQLKEFQTKETRTEIARRMEQLIKDHKPRNFNEFTDLCKSSQIEIKTSTNKATGKVQGYRVEFHGDSFKASEINRNLSYSKLVKRLSQIHEVPKPGKPDKVLSIRKFIKI
ncbi:MAG: relaxase/mobilization nuclease domain-containing protein [Draconibacterium sp.]